jgi:hypothetical protein
MPQKLNLRLKKFTLIVLLFNGFSAIYGGLSLVLDPSGASLGMSTDLLQTGPFRDFLIPGLFLFNVIGQFSLLIAVMLIFNTRYSAFLVTLEGSILLVWLVIQIVMIQTFSWMQVIMGIIGILLVFLGLLLMKPRLPVINY